MGESKAAERRSAVEMRSMFPHLYEKFNRDQWSKLRANMPLEISDEDLDALRGINDPVSLEEVETIYLPLGRLLNIHIAMATGLVKVKDSFLGRPSHRPTYIIAVTGSVAVGKSTFSRVLAEVLSRWADHPAVELVTTDGFLYPNQVLEERGLMERKGFPESYDLRKMLDFMIGLRQGTPMLKVPVYSHDDYDIVANEFLEVQRPEILILEGLNLLQLNLLGGTADAEDLRQRYDRLFDLRGCGGSAYPAMVPGAISAAEAYGVPESALILPSLCREERRGGEGFCERRLGADQPGESGEQRGCRRGSGRRW